MVTQTAPKINVQHDYISVNFGNGRRLTASWGGEKGTGAVPDAVFEAWHKMVMDKTATTPLLPRIEQFVKNIDVIWPTWNVAPKKFAVGDKVVYDFGKRHGGMDSGVITKVNRTTYDVTWAREGKIGFPGDMLAACN